MIKLSEMIDESEASDEARRLGLDYLKFGRWGKDGKVTHVTKNGKLVPADQKVGEPHPSHGAAARNVTRGRPAGEMPEPEYPINYKQGAQSPKSTPSNASWDMTIDPNVFEPYDRSQDESEPYRSIDSPNEDSPFSQDDYDGTLDTWTTDMRGKEGQKMIQQDVLHRAQHPKAALEFYKDMLVAAEEGINPSRPDPFGMAGDIKRRSINLKRSATSAIKYLNDVVKAGKAGSQGASTSSKPNVKSLSSMIPNRTPDQLKDPEDFAKNRQF